MLQSLQIRNYVLIDSLDVNFPEGLVIITGQTGAGKSILLGALSLLLGGRSDTSVIGAASDNCVVEAVFKVPDSDASVRRIAGRNDVEWNGGELILRRVVGRTGRSRCFINDSPVPLQTLHDIASRLVDIHSQHQTLLLSDPGFQLSMLDHYAGNESLLADCAASYSRLKALEKELSEVRARLERLSQERDYNEARFKALDEAHLCEGELESLEAEQEQLANAEQIKESLGAAEELLNPSDPQVGGQGVPSLLKEAQKLLGKAGKHIPRAEALAGRLESARIEIDDILGEVSALNAGTERSGERLARVEDRLSLLYDLMKRHSAASVPELIARRDALSQVLFDSTALEDRKTGLGQQAASERERLAGICARLHEARAGAAKPLAEAVSALVRSLELEHAVFEVELSQETPPQFSPDGSDTARFLFSASGSRPTDVARCASGGEMSRLMLCLKAMMARFMNMPTLIFDEIDSGVSGSAADKMGQMVCSMGKDMQVFAITHLPQVAAKGDAHYLVEKEYDMPGRQATTGIRLLEGEDRVMELARMLSGSTITPEAIANARSLLR